jgi:hypothetical protein
MFQANLGNSLRDPILKVLNMKKASGVAQVVEGLLRKCDTRSSNLSTKKPRRYLLDV